MNKLQLSHLVAEKLGIKKFNDGQPCGIHRGCLSHRFSPCEGCGRVGGFYDFSVDMNNAWVLVDAMVNKGYSLFYDKNHFSISFISDMVSASSDINSGTFCSIDQHTPTAILKAAALALGVDYE